jgi:spermidine synthase
MLILESSARLGAPRGLFLSQIAQERNNLLRFYGAAPDGSRGEREAWARDLGAVMKADPTNPYFRWIAGPP